MITDELRIATQQNHQQLEKVIVGKLRNIATTEDYIRLLSGFYGFMEPLENEIANYITVDLLADMGHRRKSAWLLNDLHALKTDFAEAFCTDLPVIDSVHTAMGALYVLEGSTLGGPVIKKTLQKKLPDLPENAFTYFSGYGERNRDYWSAFVSAVNHLQLAENEANSLLAAATDTFHYFEKYVSSVFAADKQESQFIQ